MIEFVNHGGVIVKMANGKEHVVTDLRSRLELKKNAKNIVANLNLINSMPRNKKRQEEFDKKHKPITSDPYSMDNRRIG